MKTEEIVKAMKQALQESGYPLTMSEECSSEGLIVEVNVKKIKAKLLADYDSANKGVRLTLYFQEQPPEETRDTLYGTLNEINLDLPIGHFDMCPHGGEIIMQAGYFITGDFDPVKFRLKVENN
jgi:hypothetical protein